MICAHHGGSGTDHGQIAETEPLKFQKRGQFPDDPVNMVTGRFSHLRTPKVPDPPHSRGNQSTRCPHIDDPGSGPPVEFLLYGLCERGQ